jgi:hypothetical protein
VGVSWVGRGENERGLTAWARTIGAAVVDRGGNEPSSARLAAARSCNEPSSARLAHLTSSKKRLGSARSWLASRLAESTSLGIKLNLLSKL